MEDETHEASTNRRLPLRQNPLRLALTHTRLARGWTADGRKDRLGRLRYSLSFEKASPRANNRQHRGKDGRVRQLTLLFCQVRYLVGPCTGFAARRPNC